VEDMDSGSVSSLDSTLYSYLMMGFRRRKTEYRAARVQEDGKRTSCGRLLISYLITSCLRCVASSPPDLIHLHVRHFPFSSLFCDRVPVL
jgi:hypothetical protein